MNNNSILRILTRNFQGVYILDTLVFQTLHSIYIPRPKPKTNKLVKDANWSNVVLRE